MDVKFSKFGEVKKGALVVQVVGGKLGKEAASLDKKAGGALAYALKNTPTFKGKNGDCAIVVAPKLPAEQVVLLGIDTCEKNPTKSLQSAGGKLYSFLDAQKIAAASILVEESGDKKTSVDVAAANIAFGAKLKSYGFNQYFTKKKADELPQLASFTVLTADSAKTKKAYAELELTADAIFFTRDLVSEPSNVLYPESYAKRIKALEKSGLKVTILGEKEMKKLGMNSLLCVGQGSEKESQLVVIEYNGGKKGDKPVAFVGKGVTFDTGGISIKPSKNMEDMKYDMGGSATVVGLLKLLAERKAKVNAVGVVGLVENMPSGSAIKPGDVVKSMSGQTIAVLNTDAEGRLVLADALWYTQSKFKPKFMVNLATLTGAINIALGSARCGLFSNNDELAERIYAAGKKTGDEAWRLPLGEEYDKQIDSEIADMQNIGLYGEAGSITAAQFLQRHVNNTPWAHLDIAAVCWADRPQDTVPKGARGFGVMLLDELVRAHYEK